MIHQSDTQRKTRSSTCLPAVLAAAIVLNALQWFGKIHPLPWSTFVADSPLQRSLRTSITSSSQSRRLQEMTSFRPSHSVCPNLSSFVDIAALEIKVAENVDFHQRGGNLKSVQNFLDGAIDSTLDKHKMKFVPKGGSEGVRSASRYLKQYYQEHPSERKGYGEALPGKYSDEDSKILYEKRWLDVIEPRKHHDKWDASLGPIGPDCKNLVQLGGDDGADGNKSICLPETPPAQNDLCQVISIGGNDNWTFEEAIVKQLGCITYTFDCTLPNGKPQHKPDNDNIRFFNLCIDAHSHDDTGTGKKYVSYKDALELAGIATAPTYLKIDVEGFEYDVFTSMMQTPDLLPEQIQVELHWATRMTDLSWMQRTRSAGEIALLSGMMFNTGGYMPVKLDFNPHCHSCMEVLYLRTSCSN